MNGPSQPTFCIIGKEIGYISFQLSNFKKSFGKFNVFVHNLSRCVIAGKYMGPIVGRNGNWIGLIFIFSNLPKKVLS